MSTPIYMNIYGVKYSYDGNEQFIDKHPVVSAEKIGMRISSTR